MKQATMLWAALWRSPRDKELRALLANKQWGTETLSPKACREANPANNHMSELEADPSQFEPWDVYSLGQHLGCRSVRDPEPKDPIKPHLDSWPTEIIR